ncbi:hypothetical protein OVA24_13095 [Luteolibacter sp. SL250]|uniref:hypothetical protein n=1 Tax=Luteolibacter sp. SL250 TaxID=2995170 RepID=UPI002270D91B|nr:hypothetical protein [Luteolibacter sp. SL250]WAC18173.1 hypothetical protein OVA24_13095 [Luteolibacter sp. SL250]
MTLSDSSTLSALIKAYREAVIFQEAVPTAFKVAKMFSRMRWPNGGLVLLGVSQDGDVLGVDPSDLGEIYERFGVLCAELTDSRVEMGTLAMGGKLVVFLVFNDIPRHTNPLIGYSRGISHVMHF